MKLGASRLFELQPDPYDVSQKRFFRVCLFRDVKNTSELREALRNGTIDAALVRPELISESLLTFGISEESRNLLVGIFDDENGDKIVSLAKKIDGQPVSLDELPGMVDYELIKKVYRVKESEYNEETISDAIVTRIATKDCV